MKKRKNRWNKNERKRKKENKKNQIKREKHDRKKRKKPPIDRTFNGRKGCCRK